MTITTKIEAYRGDTVMVPIRAQVPNGAVVRIHMRKTAQSEDFFLLFQSGNFVAIPPQVSAQCEGGHIFGVEATLANGTVTTLQRTAVTFIADVTRDYGSEAPNAVSDFERNVIVAKAFYVRRADNTLEEVAAGTEGQGGSGVPSAIDGGMA
jgi:hypothetical protein